MKKISVNQFNKGLNLDNNPVSVSNDSLIGALNATFITKNGNEVVLQNDMGNASVDKAHLPSGYVPLGMKEHGGIVYIASYNPFTDESQVGCFPSPQRNFSTDYSNDNLNLNSLCDYIVNNGIIDKTYQQINIYEDDIIRPGDKFVLAAEDIGNFETDPDYIKLRVFIITLDNQAIDITDEVKHPSNSFVNVPFVKNLSIDPDVQDSDYTIYNNKTSGKLCLRAELVVPYRIETFYDAEYKQLKDIITDSSERSDIINSLSDWNINDDTYLTNLHVRVEAYDEFGNIWPVQDKMSYYNKVTISNGGEIYKYHEDASNFYYLIHDGTDDSVINFKFVPMYDYGCGTPGRVISLDKSEQVNLSLIGSGKVTFNTFKYYNDFDNNHLVFNYGIKFYRNNSDYELTNLYLELIDFKHLDNVSWNYNNPNLYKKIIPLNTENNYGTYTEIIDYFSVSINTQFSINTPSDTQQFYSTTVDNGLLNSSKYFLARICAEVNGTTLYKGDWHALLTTEATNYLYTEGQQDMLNLSDNGENNKIKLDYSLTYNDETLDEDNYTENLTGNSNNYFYIPQSTNDIPQNDVLKFEIEKSSDGIMYKHEATPTLILPKHFPFTLSEINYTKAMSIRLSNDSKVLYNDNIVQIGNYSTSKTVKHYDSRLLSDGDEIGGTNNDKNWIKFTYIPGGSDCTLRVGYKLYSQLFTPYEKNGSNFVQHYYNDVGTLFLPYIEESEDLMELLNQENLIEIGNIIYPERMLFCVYVKPRFAYRTRAYIGTTNYITIEHSSWEDIEDNSTRELCNKLSNDAMIWPDPTISKYIQETCGDPNIFIFSSCVNDGGSTIHNYEQNQHIATYDMLLMKGDDNELYLLGDIIRTKGLLLKKFKDCFSKVYVSKDNQHIALPYYSGNRNNYFTTNDYKVSIDYDILYSKSNVNIIVDNYDTNLKSLDNSKVYLSKIEFNNDAITRHFTKIIKPISIVEQVSNFLNNYIVIGNLALVNDVYKQYAIDSNNRHSTFNIGDIYIQRNDNELINCRSADASLYDPNLENIVNIINNKYLKLDSSNKFVLSVGDIPRSYYENALKYGRVNASSLSGIFNLKFINNLKLFI